MLAFQHPSTILIAGPTGCGKTRFVERVLTNGMIQPSPSKIVWVYGEWQPIYDHLQLMYGGRIEFSKGYTESLYESFSPAVRNLLVLDDQMMSQARDSKDLARLFTQGSHHRNLTVIYIIQNLFDQGKAMRSISLNSHYLVLFKNPRDRGQIRTLSQQMFPSGNKASRSKFLIDAFEDATGGSPYGYLVIDLKPDTPDRFRIRTRIFPDEQTAVYVQR